MKIDGPRLAARSRRASSLVVLLHGYGADGNDLIALGEAWSARMPDTAFVAPHAPDFLPGETLGGRQWFDLTFRDPDELWDGARKAAPGLTAFLTSELARHELPATRLALAGFSQGCMMALHVAARFEPQVAAVLGYSGAIAGPEHLAADTVARPPAMLIHGTDDEVIPAGAVHQAREALAAAGFNVEWHLIAGLGHGIDSQGLDWGGRFLAERLAG